MDANFWIQAWKEGRTNFHKEQYNEKLLTYFPRLNPERGQRVLVPLCGKTKDLLWLSQLGLKVHGIELHEEALLDFFTENKLPVPTKTQDENYINYCEGNIRLSCGDFFKLPQNENYDFIYDRASLVALPGPMRKDYSQVIKRALKPHGKYLLIVFEYTQEEMDGPPFSVSENEIYELYKDSFKITLLESESLQNEGTKFEKLSTFKQKVYLLEKH
jgi:thiopurine S-methyltransferase